MANMNSNYIEWCNENEGRAYPLAERATLRTLQGTAFPGDIIADMGLLLPSVYSDVYISSVRVTPALYSVCIASTQAPLLVCTVSRIDYTPYQAVAMTPQVENVTGWAVFGSHRTVIPEQFDFAGSDASGLEARVIRYVDPPPVRRFIKYGGTAAQAIDGLVELYGGNVLRIYQDPADESNIIFELNEEARTAFLGPCDVYADSGNYMLTPVRTISGVSPDEDGVITLRFTT